MKANDIMLGVFLAFTLTYATIGDPNSNLWSGLYFFVHYLTLLILFNLHQNKIIRLTGIALSISIIIFIFCRYILGLEIDRQYTIIPFFITLYGLFKLEKKYEPRNRKSI